MKSQGMQKALHDIHAQQDSYCHTKPSTKGKVGGKDIQRKWC